MKKSFLIILTATLLTTGCGSTHSLQDEIVDHAIWCQNNGYTVNLIMNKTGDVTGVECVMGTSG